MIILHRGYFPIFFYCFLLRLLGWKRFVEHFRLWFIGSCFQSCYQALYYLSRYSKVMYAMYACFAVSTNVLHFFDKLPYLVYSIYSNLYFYIYMISVDPRISSLTALHINYPYMHIYLPITKNLDKIF